MGVRELGHNEPFPEYGNWASNILHFKQVDRPGDWDTILSNFILLNPVCRTTSSKSLY